MATFSFKCANMITQPLTIEKLVRQIMTLEKLYLNFISAITLAIVVGCSNASVPSLPSLPPKDLPNSSEGHINLGLWTFYIDPENENYEITPLRAIQTHMNALAFMEPPAGVFLKIDKIVSVAPGDITLDIRLTHPYPSAGFAAAFDVCGILISHGSKVFPLTDDLYFAGEGEVRLLNPDGYTRWWNPTEFPPNPAKPHKGYIDGLMGKPHSQVNFTAKLNGYKYFATDLTSPDADLSTLNTNMRGAFLPGTSCVRRYHIAFPPGSLVFNYAVDANWAPPSGNPPFDIPDDFPPSANRPEAYRIELHDVANSLEWDSSSGTASGMLTMSVYVYDWFDAGKNMVCAYAQNDELLGMCNPIPVGGGETYSVYTVELWPMAMNSADDILVWFEVECKESGYQGMIPGELQAIYWNEIFPVAGD